MNPDIVAGEAFAVDAGQGGGAGRVTEHRGQVFDSASGAVGDGPEGAVGGGDFGVGAAFDGRGAAPVVHQFFDGDDGQVLVCGEGVYVLAAEHVAFVCGGDRADQSDGGQTGEGAQVDGCFGVAGPSEDSAVAGTKR